MKKIIFFILSALTICIAACQSTIERDLLKQMLMDFHVGDKVRNKSFSEQLLIANNIYYRAKEIDYYEGMATSLTKMADLEMAMGNTASSLKHIQEGIALAKKTNLTSEETGLLQLKGHALINQGYIQNGKKLIYEAMRLSNDISDSNERYFNQMLLNISMVDFFSGSNPEWKLNSDSVVYYRKMAYEQAQKVTKDSPEYMEAKIFGEFQLAFINIHLAQTKNQNAYLLPAEQHLAKASDLINKANYKDMLHMLYMAYCRIELKKGNVQKGIEYCQQSLSILKQFDYTYESEFVLNLMSSLYGHLGDHAKEAHYLKLSVSLADSLHNREKEAIKVSLPFVKEERSNIFLFIYLGISILVGGAVILLFRFKKRKINRQLNFEQAEIEQIPSTNNPPLAIDKDKLMEVVELAKSNSELFYISFLELYPDFKNKLLRINAQLSVSDCEFCALLKLNFDTKQIARYRNLSIRSVDSKKYRIRKKLGLTSEEDIYAFFLDV